MTFLLAAGSAWAQPNLWEIDSAHSSAQFTVRHLMISNVRGEFSKLTGSVQLDETDLAKSSVQAVIDATTINTREPQRDAHLKSPDFFNVAQFPTLTFQSRKVIPGEAGKFKLIGDLTMHGVTREVTLEVNGPTPAIKDPWGNQRRGISASTVLNRKDFGLTWNKALETGGVVVGEEVTINIDLEFVRKK
jgi:polyisoprenoid-binding protein YceI